MSKKNSRNGIDSETLKNEEIKGKHIDVTESIDKEVIVDSEPIETSSDDESGEESIQNELSELDTLKIEAEALRQEVNIKNDQLLRRAAEFDNMKKRVGRERIQIFEKARIDAISEFLPVNDDLKRTLEASADVALNEQFLKGVQMVSDKFDSVLDKYGVSRIDEIGVPFNVDFHEALMKQPANDDKTESNTVLQVLDPGYKLGDRVIRHAKVIVSE